MVSELNENLEGMWKITIKKIIYTKKEENIFYTTDYDLIK